MEVVSRGGRPVTGFALGDAGPGVGSNVAVASLMTGAAVGLFVYIVKAPVWASVLAGTGAALVTKLSIDRA